MQISTHCKSERPRSTWHKEKENIFMTTWDYFDVSSKENGEHANTTLMGSFHSNNNEEENMIYIY